MSYLIPDIPEDAPFSPEQRAWLRSYVGELIKSISAMQSCPPDAPTKPRALFLFGSQSGNAQALCEEFAENLSNDGWVPEVKGLEDHDKIDLANEALVLVVTSTWGEGDPPDNAVGFWEKFSSDDQAKLPNTRYAVLALGDTNYSDFCEMGKKVDARFIELGAERIAPRVDCDLDYEDPAEAWFRSVVTELEKIGTDTFLSSAGSSPGNAPAAAPEDLPYGKKNPFPAGMKHRYRLNLEPSPRDTRHIELSLEGSGLSYEVGDALATYPVNDPDLVDEILSILPFNTKVSVEIKDRGKILLRDALLECCDIRTVTKSILKKWAAMSYHPYLNASIEDDKAVAKILDGIEIVDLIYEFPVDFKTAQDFVAVLRRLNPRLYSIASSPLKNPGEVHLTVARVSYESKGRTRNGVASTFLCQGLEEGGSVKVFVQPTKHFKLPTDLSKDIIMVGPGTGIAPFRAFLEEREATEATGRNWLFFGNPHEATDYFYKEEFDRMHSSGVLTRIDLAWSRDQAHKIYVQDKIRENEEEIWNWLEAGAHFYVCGDAQYMAPDVEAALLDSIRKFGGMDDEAAAAYLEKLRAEHRYQRDVY